MDSRLGSAELAGANFTEAHLERAVLRGANINESNFTFAYLNGADLRGAQMFGANFFDANLDDARLGGAEMESATLYAAELNRADLGGTNLKGTTFETAELEEAILSHAEMIAANFRHTKMDRAVLARAHIESTDLYGARLRGADLGNAMLIGKPDEAMVLDGTDLIGVLSDRGVLRFVDLSRAVTNPISDLRNTFADGSVTLAEGAVRPCQWARARLSDEAFHARWRGWLNLSPDHTDIIWRSLAREEWYTVEAIPPDDPTCTWHD